MNTRFYLTDEGWTPGRSRSELASIEQMLGNGFMPPSWHWRIVIGSVVVVASGVSPSLEEAIDDVFNTLTKLTKMAYARAKADLLSRESFDEVLS